MDKNTSNIIAWFGRGITTFGGLLAFIMFFLPWVLVSCGGQELGTISGYQLATGSGLLEHADAKAPILFVTWFLILLAIVIAFVVPKKTIAGAVNVFLALLAVVVVLLVYVKLHKGLSESDIQVRVRAGLIGTLIGYFLMMGGGFVELAAGLFEGGASAPSRRKSAPARASGHGVRDWLGEALSPPDVMGGTPRSESYVEDDSPTLLPGESTAVLLVTSGPWAGRKIPVRGDNILIGRGSQGCQICIPDRYVSRRHALLRFAQGQWFIQDQQSRGGTFVNGQRVGATRLNDGDIIRVGQTEMVFKF